MPRNLLILVFDLADDYNQIEDETNTSYYVPAINTPALWWWTKMYTSSQVLQKVCEVLLCVSNDGGKVV